MSMMPADSPNSPAPRPWVVELRALEAALIDCLLFDQQRLAERIRSLRRKLRGRGRKLRPAYVERNLAQLRDELGRSQRVREARAALRDRLPYFVSGVAYPDYTVLTPAVYLQGIDAVLAAGYFDGAWR